MGNPNAEKSDQNSSLCSHFSHPHPLYLTNIPLSSPSIPCCSACKLEASSLVYSCTSCAFFLHKKCYDLPQKIKHEFDQSHVLSLQPKPVYPEGLFKCDACGKQGDGFSYHCSPCGTDIHSICASLPMELAHQCHPHKLGLTFSAPYAGEAFSCDICKRIGSKIWLYRCNSCEFDVHLTCLTAIPSVSTHQHQMVPQLSASRSLPNNPSNVMYNNPNVGVYSAPRPLQPATYPAAMAPMNLNPPGNYGRVRPVNNILRDRILAEVANGVASGIAQGATQVVMQEVMGIGGGGGGGGGGGNQVVAAADGGSYYDGGYSGTDVGYGGVDGSYN